MKQPLVAFRQRLGSAPVTPLHGRLVRMVAFAALEKVDPPEWLFTSGKPNRYNPAKVECVCFAEDEATARAEHAAFWAGLAGENQPVVLYYADVRLHRILDLNSATALKAVGLKRRDLFASWRRAKRPTLTQLLGQAISEQCAISAIRYPSKAAKEPGFPGANVAIFRDCVRRPDSVCILGPTKRPLQKWP